MRTATEPPSCPRQLIFMVGQDGRGNWVVQDRAGNRGGLFVDRTQALRYIRAENGDRPQAFVLVSGILELDMSRKADAAACPPVALDTYAARRLA